MQQSVVKNEEPKDIGDLISEAFRLTQGKEDREELVLDYLCQSVTKADSYDALVAKAKNNEPYAFIQLASWHISHAQNVKDYCKALEYAKKAVNYHYVEGYYILGQLYYYGTGCEQNMVRALKYFQVFLEQVDHKQVINDAVLKDTYQKLIEGNIKINRLAKAKYYMSELKEFDPGSSNLISNYSYEIDHISKDATQSVLKQTVRLFGCVLFLLLLFIGVKYLFPNIDLRLDRPIILETNKVSADEFIIYADTPKTNLDEIPETPKVKNDKPALVTSVDFFEYGLREVSPSNVWSSTEYISSKGIDYSANCILDHNASTLWQEGVSGPGIGECIHFDFEQEIMLYGIVLSNGKMSSEEGYYNNNRLASFRIIGEEEYVIDLEDVFEKQYIYFESPMKMTGMDFIIESVFEGLKYDDTCVTDIEFYVQ